MSTQASTSSVGDGCGSTCLVSIWSTFHGSNVFTFMNIGSKGIGWVIWLCIWLMDSNGWKSYAFELTTNKRLLGEKKLPIDISIMIIDCDDQNTIFWKSIISRNFCQKAWVLPFANILQFLQFCNPPYFSLFLPFVVCHWRAARGLPNRVVIKLNDLVRTMTIRKWQNQQLSWLFPFKDHWPRTQEVHLAFEK